MSRYTPETCRLDDQRGVAIVIVLWVIMVLSLLISGFAFTMHVETQIASYARKELKAEMLARSGIEVAKMQLLLHQQSAADAEYDALNQNWVTNEELYVNHELGDGVFNVKITDEESKMPINTASEVQLERLMTLLSVDPSDGDIIVDSILDWIGPGELTRLNGAKSDYYMSLSPPYRAKDAPMDRVDELLLVRGVTPELFDWNAGNRQRPGPTRVARRVYHHELGSGQREHGVPHRAPGDAGARRGAGAGRAGAAGWPRRHSGHGR